MPTAGVTHDLTIAETNGSTNKRGFMLARDADLRRFGVEDAEAVPPRVLASGDFTEVESPPHIRAYWSQTNWSGMGGVVARGDTVRPRFALLEAAKTDVDGRLRAGPAITQTAVSASPTEDGTTGFAVVGTELWAFVGRDVYYYDPAGPTWTKGTVPNAATRIYRNGVSAPSSYVIAPSWNPATDAADRYIYKRDADADWSRIGAGTGSSPKYLTTGRNANGAAVVWAGHVDGNVAQIMSSTDISSLANWSGATTVGSANTEITAMLDLSNTLLICKQDGVWVLTPGGVTSNLLPEYEHAVHQDNFRGAIVWNGRALLPIGVGGLLELVGTTLYDISLRNYLPEQTQLHGMVMAMAGTPTRLFLLVRDTTNSVYRIVMGQIVEGDYEWHEMGSISSATEATNARYHAAMLPAGVLIGSTAVSLMLVGISRTVGNNPHQFQPDPQQSDWTYTTGTTRGTTEVFDAGFPHLSKTFASLDAEFANLGAGSRTITVEYRTTRGGSWTSLGTLNSTSNTQTLNFSAATTGLTLEYRFTLVTTSPANATGPELIRFRTTYSLRSPQIETIPLNIYLADHQLLLNGSTESRVAGALAQLRTWDTQAAEVTVVDAEGTSRDMVFQPGTLKVTELAREGGRRSEWLVRAQLVEV